MELNLVGYANDYVGKGIAGGKIIIAPPQQDIESAKKSSRTGAATQFSLAGNTNLYGATGGTVYIRGRAGERFAVRNSGALGVIEGLGDHGCEYMTGGSIIVLGAIGRNFAAGMTGGLAFILDDEAWLDGASDSSTPANYKLEHYINKETVSVVKLSTDYRYYQRSTIQCSVQ